MLFNIFLTYRNSLIEFSNKCAIMKLIRVPTPKWMLPRVGLFVPKDTAYPVGRQDRHFFIYLCFSARDTKET